MSILKSSHLNTGFVLLLLLLLASTSPARAQIAATSRVGTVEIPIATPANLSPTATTASSAAAVARRASVRMAGSTLLVDGKPTGIRAIEYRGEPLHELKRLGFNAVWVNARPTPSLLQEAKACSLFLVCSPPAMRDLTNRQPTDFDAVPLSDPIYDPVLFWNLGTGLIKSDLSVYAEWAATLKTASPDRLLLCLPESGVWDYSRLVDVVLFRREPVLTTMGLREYTAWQRAVPHLVRPDTTIWGTIQTQPDPRLIAQWQLFGGSVSESAALTYEQVQLLVHLALGAGCHGLLFSSSTPLLGNDPDTEYRRRVLELVNSELMLVEEWFSRGDPVDTVEPTTGSGMQMVLLKTPRSRLLVPTAHARQSFSDLAPSPPGETRYIVPGVPDTYTAYHLLPGDISTLRATRIAGGMEVVISEATPNSLIFFTEEPAVLTTATQRSRELGQRMAQLAYELALRRVETFEQVYLPLRQMQATQAIPTVDRLPMVTLTEQESLIASTRSWISLCADFYASRQNASAYLQAEKATRGVRVVERDTRVEATRYDLNEVMVPTAISFGTLPAYLAWRSRAQGGGRDVNRLPTGDAEDVAAWLRAGWTVEEYKTTGVVSAAQLTIRAAHTGRSGLELLVREEQPKTMPATLETPPLWVTSPPITVRMGEVLCLSGWISIAEPLTGGHDGVMVIDSLGGEALALRVGETQGWREFAAYRVAPFDGQMKIVIVVSGGGRVWLDNLEVTGVQYHTPVTTPDAPNTPYWQRLNPFQYLPSLPNLPTVPTPWR